MPEDCEINLAQVLLEAARATEPFVAPLGKDRGIVVCAGGPVMIANAYVLVRLLREHLNSVLPIEIWHCGPKEMPRFLARQFTQLGCDVVDALRVHSSSAGGSLPLDGWQLKAHALRYTGFENVLLLDADQVPVRDPAEIFDWPEYHEIGAVFWPDVIDLSIHNPVWKLFCIEPRQVCSWETGQLCVNRKRHWLPVCLVHEMNRRADVVYSKVYGDKDTFLLSWLMLKADHALIPYKPFADEHYFYQRDFAGAGLFQHRSNCKWSLYGDNIEPDGFELFSVCESYLSELRSIWNGRIFFPQGAKPRSRRLEKAIAARRKFALTLGSQAAQTVELLAGNQIGRGRSYSLMNWYVGMQEDDDGICLCDANKVIAFLKPGEGGTWYGKTIKQPSQPIIMYPADQDVEENASIGAVGSLVGDLIAASWNGGYHDEKSVQMIAAALQSLSSVDPSILDEIRDSVTEYRQQDPRLAGFLEALESKLKLPCGDRPSTQSHGLLYDETYYVRT